MSTNKKYPPVNAAKVKEILGKIKSPDGKQWWLAGSAVKTTLGDTVESFAIFDEFSKTAMAKYDAARVRKTWDAINPGKHTAGTLYFLVRETGGDGDSDDTAQADITDSVSKAGVVEYIVEEIGREGSPIQAALLAEINRNRSPLRIAIGKIVNAGIRHHNGGNNGQ